MIAETVSIISSTSKNSLGKLWEPVWIPYHNGFGGVPYIPFCSTAIRTKDPVLVALVISCNNGRHLIYRESFSKWKDNGNPAAKKLNFNAWFLFND